MRRTLALLLLALPAAAYVPADAPMLDRRIEATWIEPAALAAGDQWQAFIRFAPGTNVTAVGYQACVVPGACIISPRNATRIDERTWGMDTASYRDPVGGENYPWPAGHVGVKWFVAEDGRPFVEGVAIPEGLDPADPACINAEACLHTHYFTAVVESEARGLPAGNAVLALVVLAVVAWMRRR